MLIIVLQIIQKILLENIIKVHQCIETPSFIKFFTKPFVLEYQGIPERLYERDYIVFGTSEDISYLLQALMSQINPRLILDQESQQLLHRFASLLIQSTFDYINSVDGITKENYVGYIEDFCEMVFPSNLSNFVRMDVRSSIEQNNDLYSAKECAFASIGDGLTDTEAANFYTAVQTFQTTLSRNV